MYMYTHNDSECIYLCVTVYNYIYIHTYNTYARRQTLTSSTGVSLKKIRFMIW